MLYFHSLTNFISVETGNFQDHTFSRQWNHQGIKFISQHVL
jgi:hypothetical protein